MQNYFYLVQGGSTPILILTFSLQYIDDYTGKVMLLSNSSLTGTQITAVSNLHSWDMYGKVSSE